MYSITNIFHASYLYQIPAKSSKPMLNAVIGNWQFSGIVTLDSGPPVFAVLTSDNENIGSIGRLSEFPNLVCNPLQGFTYSLSEAINTSCYQLPAYGTRGYAGKLRRRSRELGWGAGQALALCGKEIPGISRRISQLVEWGHPGPSGLELWDAAIWDRP